MKSLFALLLAIVSYTVQGQPSKGIQLMSCKIVYSFYDGMQRGTKTLIFTDSGKIERVSVVSYPDTTNHNMPKEILNGLKAMKATIIKTRDSIFTIDEYSEEVQRKVRFFLGSSVGIIPGMNKIADEKFLNRECEVYDFSGFKMWYWKGIVLKKEISFAEGEHAFETATSVDEKYVISENDFKIPDFGKKE